MKRKTYEAFLYDLLFSNMEQPKKKPFNHWISLLPDDLLRLVLLFCGHASNHMLEQGCRSISRSIDVIWKKALLTNDYPLLTDSALWCAQKLTIISNQPDDNRFREYAFGEYRAHQWIHPWLKEVFSIANNLASHMTSFARHSNPRRFPIVPSSSRSQCSLVFYHKGCNLPRLCVDLEALQLCQIKWYNIETLIPGLIEAPLDPDWYLTPALLGDWIYFWLKSNRSHFIYFRITDVVVPTPKMEGLWYLTWRLICKPVTFVMEPSVQLPDSVLIV